MSGERARRVAWAGPLRAGSAIGRDGVGAAEGLAGRGWEVELIATDHDWSEEAPRLPFDLPHRHWSQLHLPHLANAYDSVVVNVGDHFLNHAGAFPLMEAAPCLAVVHDMFLGNLFNGWLWWKGSIPGWREAHMADAYPADGAELARRYERGELPLEEQAARAPMTEWLARRAAGCLAHSAFYVPRLLASCAGPVDVAGLPVASRGIAPLAERAAGGKLELLTVGNMNPNKCVDRVIEALAGSPALRERVRYRLVGSIADEEARRLKEIARVYGFGGLMIEGPADETQLNAALERADVIACLRRPVLEGQSGSLVEALLAGRPTVVADAGCYADLPDDVAAKVPADVPVEVLRAALERLAGDEPERRAVGARARAYAEARFSLERYLDVLEPLMRATAAAAPVLRMTRTLGSHMAELGLLRSDPAAGRIAATLQPLFAPSPAANQGASSAAG